MAVEWVKEIHDGRSGDINEQGETSYRRVFDVKTDDPADDPTVVLAAPGVPRWGNLHPSNPSIYVTGVHARSASGRYGMLWSVEVEYSSAPEQDPVTTDPTQPPEQRVPELEVDFVAHEEVLEQDLDGNWLMNTADDFYPPEQRTVDIVRPVFRFTRFFGQFDFFKAYDWCNVVNSVPWQGILPGKARISVERARRVFEQGQLYWEVSFAIQTRQKGWRLKVPNEGFHAYFNFLDGEGKSHICYRDDENPDVWHPVSHPVPLNGIGHVLPQGQEPIIREHRVYEERDFSQLGI